MEKIYLNQRESVELYEKGNYVPKRCYDNVFDHIGSVGCMFLEEDIKVMFCYVKVLEGLYTRHACYYLDGMAVDPTIVAVYRGNVENCKVDYIPIKIMSVDEYLKLISREHRTDLFKTFRLVEKIKQEELQESGITIIG